MGWGGGQNTIPFYTVCVLGGGGGGARGKGLKLRDHNFTLSFHSGKTYLFGPRGTSPNS